MRLRAHLATLCLVGSLGPGVSGCTDTLTLTGLTTETGLRVDPAEFIAPEDCLGGRAGQYVARLVDLTDPSQEVRVSPPTSCLSAVRFLDVVATAGRGVFGHSYRADIELYAAGPHDGGALTPRWIGSCGAGTPDQRSRPLVFLSAPGEDASTDAGAPPATTSDAGDALIGGFDASGGPEISTPKDAAVPDARDARPASESDSGAVTSTDASSTAALEGDASPGFLGQPRDAGAEGSPTSVPGDAQSDSGSSVSATEDAGPSTYGGGLVPVSGNVSTFRACLLTAVD